MSPFDRLAELADAVLYEGYLLYPYRPDALKNRRRWTFGCLLPERWAAALGEPWRAQVECLLRGDGGARLAVRARFLHLSDAGPAPARVEAGATVARLLEREVVARGGFGAVEASLHLSAAPAGANLYRVRARLANATVPEGDCPPSRDEALGRGLLSCHALLAAEGATFVSAIDPPADCRAAAAGCRSEGLWPVLAGDPAAPAAMLAAPIILYDHPRVAPQSPADLFDATEIDEMLRLRVLTLAGHEKAELARGDERARRVMERLSGLGEADALALRGAWRAGPRRGDRVRLRPGRRADLLDRALAGKEATVVSVDEDLEGRTHVAVVIDDDPGRDLGLAGWPGHRFFFAADEVEVLP